MASVNEIRSAFLNYFHREGHEIVPSSPLVPRNDPTLMFTNAGMVQFKDYFTGKARPSFPRAVTAQKCVRAGGKHNDLDNVGYTARHHTFFEMLGNFSFGDYFKERAIELAWNLVTKEFGLPKEKLTATVYVDDDEAFDLWKKIAGLPESRIIRIAGSDNFWAMGDTGPCGPCSEIFYDHGEGIPGGPPGSPDADGDRFIEIWNLVFMQFEQVSKDERINLPKPAVDTGMGLERTAAVMQGVHDNYDIDLFKTLIAAIHEHVGRPSSAVNQASPRVIADHLRATSFLIADGVLPSNEGRGYVLRRIMRRAMRHAHLLGADEPAIFRLVPTLVHEMGQAYPELGRAEGLISETLRLEEGRFLKTLARGLSLLEEATGGLQKGAYARRRDGLQALRHLRLPARPDAGRAEGARHRRRSHRLQRRHGAAARRGARELGGLGRCGDRERLAASCATGTARPNSSATTPRAPRRRCSRSSRTAPRPRRWTRATRARSSSTRRRSTASPAGRSATPA